MIVLKNSAIGVGISEKICDKPSLLFENLVNKKQLAEHLKFSQSYINKLMNQGLPRIKSGRAVRFRISEVMRWIERKNS